MSSSPPASPPDASPASRADVRWLLLFLGGMAAAGALCWLGYPPAAAAYRSWRIHQHLSAATEHMAGQKWAAAASALREARKLGPEDPDVLHASLDFLQHLGENRDPQGAVSLVERLEKTGHAMPADLVLMGRMQVLLGQVSQARKVYNALSPADRETTAARELLAALLAAEGQTARAQEVRRAILQETADKPESLRQLARLEFNGGTPEARRALRQRLWQLARAAGPLRPTAIELLAQDPLLTLPQAEELARGVAALPPPESEEREQRDILRMQVASAHMRLSPQSRQEQIDQEIGRWKDRPPAQARPLVTWLAREGEHARILRLVPAALAAKFTDLLPPYVDALRNTNQWRELDSFLSSGGIDAAFSKTQKMLWQAEARARLDSDTARARQMIAALIEESGRGDDLPLALKTGQLAERLAFWDVASRCFAACAEKHASVRPAMLVKVYEMAEHEHDGAGMLQACTQLAALQPENQSVREQKVYLQLLLGVDVELAEREMPSLAKDGVPARAGQRQLISALLAFRQGRHEEVPALLAAIPAPSTLGPGERAVYAGLLKSSGGDATAAFRIIEKITPSLLLEEEKRFAKRAL